MDEPEIEATNFTLQYCLRKDHKIVQVRTITVHTFEELMKKLKTEFPYVGEVNVK